MDPEICVTDPDSGGQLITDLARSRSYQDIHQLKKNGNKSFDFLLFLISWKL
jgi:hypothetical protein